MSEQNKTLSLAQVDDLTRRALGAAVLTGSNWISPYNRWSMLNAMAFAPSGWAMCRFTVAICRLARSIGTRNRYTRKSRHRHCVHWPIAVLHMPLLPKPRMIFCACPCAGHSGIVDSRFLFGRGGWLVRAARGQRRIDRTRLRKFTLGGCPGTWREPLFRY